MPINGEHDEQEGQEGEADDRDPLLLPLHRGGGDEGSRRRRKDEHHHHEEGGELLVEAEQGDDVVHDAHLDDGLADVVQEFRDDEAEEILVSERGPEGLHASSRPRPNRRRSASRR